MSQGCEQIRAPVQRITLLLVRDSALPHRFERLEVAQNAFDAVATCLLLQLAHSLSATNAASVSEGRWF